MVTPATLLHTCSAPTQRGENVNFLGLSMTLEQAKKRLELSPLQLLSEQPELAEDTQPNLSEFNYSTYETLEIITYATPKS